MPATDWRQARIKETIRETRRAVTLVLEVDGWTGHRAGQHVDVRLTDPEDGYQAQRSYSIAGAPEDGLQITVERLEDGEVSPWFVDVATPGDAFDVRGPFGGWFVYDPKQRDPLLLIAGGSGLVPLMAMLRARRNAQGTAPARLLVSAREPDDVLYAAELPATGAELVFTYTRSAPDTWQGYRKRVDQEILERVAYAPEAGARTYVCGPTAFVESVANGLLALGHDPATIRTERFGATGGG
jgi:ferredoxin-NADP reductase